MIETIKKFEELLKIGLAYLTKSEESEMSSKISVEKWSKKEILGHLIDSGINNLQRFTEIQFESKPYRIRKYNQNELVKANNYQTAKTDEIIDFWKSINYHILNLMKIQTDITLNYEIEFYDGKLSNLEFLMKDYVKHLEHHLNQIMK